MHPLGFWCAALAGTCVAMSLASCGPSNNQISVAVSASGTDPLKPGQTVSYTVSVTNRGPGAVTGVTARVDLPADMRYKATPTINGDGQARTQPVDPAVNTPNPQWGLWSLSAPRVNGDGSPRYAHIDITFMVAVAGSPGHYDLVPKASSDTLDGEAVGQPLGLDLTAAAHLSISAEARPTHVRPGDVVAYHVTVTNDGSGIAGGVSVLATLPPVMSYAGTDQLQGNFSRSSASDPARGAILAFYSGFTIPAHSDSGPGLVSWVMRAQVDRLAPPGSYPITLQMTDAQGDIVTLDGVQPVTVVTG